MFCSFPLCLVSFHLLKGCLLHAQASNPVLQTRVPSAKHLSWAGYALKHCTQRCNSGRWAAGQVHAIWIREQHAAPAPHRRELGPFSLPADVNPQTSPAHELQELDSVRSSWARPSPFFDQRIKLCFAPEPTLVSYWREGHRAGGPLLGTDLGGSVTFLSSLYVSKYFFEKAKTKAGRWIRMLHFQKRSGCESSHTQGCDSTLTLPTPLIKPMWISREAMWNTIEISIVSSYNRLFYNLWKGSEFQRGEKSDFMQVLRLKIISIWENYPQLETLNTMKDSMRTHLCCYQ